MSLSSSLLLEYSNLFEYSVLECNRYSHYVERKMQQVRK